MRTSVWSARWKLHFGNVILQIHIMLKISYVNNDDENEKDEKYLTPPKRGRKNWLKLYTNNNVEYNKLIIIKLQPEKNSSSDRSVN